MKNQKNKGAKSFRKILPLTASLVVFLVLIAGCVIEEVKEDTLDDSEEQVLDDDLSDINSIEEDLNFSELDEIDQMLAELEEI